MAVGLPREAGSGVTEPGRPAVPGPPRPTVPPSPPVQPAARAGWTRGRVIALVAGSALILISLVLLGGAGLLTWADGNSRAAT